MSVQYFKSGSEVKGLTKRVPGSCTTTDSTRTCTRTGKTQVQLLGAGTLLPWESENGVGVLVLV